MYVRMRYSLILPLETDWETTLLRHQVELEWRLKVFPSTSNLLFLNFTVLRYTFLFFYSETYMVHVINCEWSRSVNFSLRIFYMRYKHVFFRTPFTSNFYAILYGHSFGYNHVFFQTPFTSNFHAILYNHSFGCLVDTISISESNHKTMI